MATREENLKKINAELEKMSNSNKSLAELLGKHLMTAHYFMHMVF